MSMHEVRNMGYHESPHLITMGDVAGEVRRAREKFPDRKHLLAALTEEVGELSKGLLENSNWREEAMQVAAVAIRIMEECDSVFPECCEQLSKSDFPKFKSRKDF